jgi:hypothetical protein
MVPEAGGKMKRVQQQVDFPDAELNKSFYRRWSYVEDPSLGKDPWKELGYTAAVRWAQKAIVYSMSVDDAEVPVEGPRIKILEGSKSLFDQFAKATKNLEKMLAQDGEKRRVDLAGAEAPKLDIDVSYNTKNENMPIYNVMAFPKISPLDESEIAELLKGYTPEPELLAAIRASKPDFESYPDYLFGGWNLSHIYRPEHIRSGNNEENSAVSQALLGSKEEPAFAAPESNQASAPAASASSSSDDDDWFSE